MDIRRPNVVGLNTKLETFAETLDPDERLALSQLLSVARSGLEKGEVIGFDAGGSDHDLLTKINWDGLTTLAVAPGTVVDHGNLGGGRQ